MAQKNLTRIPNPSMMPEEYARIRDRLMVYAKECIPISTACAAEGIDYSEWVNREDKFPALRQELLKAAALCKIEWQRKALKGGAGWQVYFTALERLDSGNFSRTQAAGRPPNDRNPYDAAMRRKGKK